MKLGLNFNIKFNNFLILTPNRLGLSPLTAFVLFNWRDDVLFNSTDSISFFVIRNFRLFISHSDLSISVSFLNSSKMCKSLIECILYFSRFCSVDSVFLFLKRFWQFVLLLLLEAEVLSCYWFRRLQHHNLVLVVRKLYMLQEAVQLLKLISIYKTIQKIWTVSHIIRGYAD